MSFIIEDQVFDGYVILFDRGHDLVTFNLEYPGVIGPLNYKEWFESFE